MSTNTPQSSGPADGDRTAVSGAGHAAPPTEPTLTGGAADATVVRGSPSAPTLGDVSTVSDGRNFGKYELLGELARGGMGVVYRARQHGLDRVVALKMVLGTGADAESAQRFLQEARAAAALDHPNVVPIYDTGETNGKPYFTMALVDGPNLRGHAEARGVLPIAEVVALFAQVVHGVAHAHRHGIIHRDLKPANVLIDRDGRPRVTDFGLAKRTTVDSHLTATGQVVGTPSYMAPEQARDSKDVGPPADVYSLGAILYFLLTGRPPFHGDSFTDLLIKVVTDAPVPPGQIRADVPADLEALCLRCLAKQPAARFADATELAEALIPFTEQYPLSGSRPGLGRSGTGRVSSPSTGAGTVPELSALVAAGSLVPRSAPAPRPEPPTTAAPARNRLPVVIGLVALAAVLLALVGYLATRGAKAPEGAKTDAPAGAPPSPSPTPTPHEPIAPKLDLLKSALSKLPKHPHPATGDHEADKFAWGAPSADFELKIEIIEPMAIKDADGTFRLAAGKQMKVRLTAEKDCRVSAWVIEPNGNYTRLLPNDYEADDRLTAGKERVLPGNDTYVIDTNPTVGAGADRLRVVATTGEPPAFPPGDKSGPFSTYSSASDRERVASTVRGVTLKKTGASKPNEAVAIPELLFRVEK